MSSSGYLAPPSKDPSQENLWVETWKRLDRFLPDLRKELDLDGPKENEKVKENEKPVVVEQAKESSAAPAS
jgi:brefeldin A-resistance guanine nucleotide exchange factor 1